MNTIRLMLVDDHDIVRNGIKSLLEREEGIEVIAEAANGEEAIKVASEANPDIIIMDIKMPVMSGIEATRKIKQLPNAPKIIILSMHDLEEYVLQSVECGADGYLLKDTGKESFLKAISKVHAGEKYFSSDIAHVFVNTYLNNVGSPTSTPKPSAPSNNFNLTNREKQVLKMVVEGFTNKDIAEELDKSVRTIETHRFKIMKKLDVHNAIEMMKVVEEFHLLED